LIGIFVLDFLHFGFLASWQGFGLTRFLFVVFIVRIFALLLLLFIACTTLFLVVMLILGAALLCLLLLLISLGFFTLGLLSLETHLGEPLHLFLVFTHLHDLVGLVWIDGAS